MAGRIALLDYASGSAWVDATHAGVPTARSLHPPRRWDMRILTLTGLPRPPHSGQRLRVDHSRLMGLDSGLDPGGAGVGVDGLVHPAAEVDGSAHHLLDLRSGESGVGCSDSPHHRDSSRSHRRHGVDAEWRFAAAAEVGVGQQQAEESEEVGAAAHPDLAAVSCRSRAAVCCRSRAVVCCRSLSLGRRRGQGGIDSGRPRTPGCPVQELGGVDHRRG